ncbi:DinB family protein [Arthrobacter sp. H41]|uniref:DinB family protein n=1 Tax=Arthrobacter sp. H41 TaxID=1312978 RepID=UPI00047B8505|nr:DinB family protein [Arthrobacter sp. H41]
MPSHDRASFPAPLRQQFDSFLDDHRRAIHDCLDGMTEEEARRRLVSSETTLLGLVKHATFVELVWFNEAITCRSRHEIGCPAGPDESFEIEPSDTIDAVRTVYRQVCAASRDSAASLGIDDVVNGNHRGPLPMRWIYLHALRELAQHCGHADILREQILARRNTG